MARHPRGTTGQPLKKTTISLRLGMLRVIIERLIEWDRPDAPARNPIFGPDRPRLDEPLPTFLDDDHAARFMAAATRLDPFRRLVVEILARTGLRVGEFCALQADAIVELGDTHWLRVPVGKLHTDRYIPLHPILLDLHARRRITAAVTASKTTVTELFGVGPIVTATVIGDVGDIARFPTRDHFAACNGTAPIEVSSGGRRKVFRLSRRGNRRLNHAIHMAAVTQIRFRHTAGRAYYDRKIAEGHSGKEAIRALKRRISDARPLRPPPPRRRTGRTRRRGSGRAHGERLCRLRARLSPRAPTLRPSHSRTRPQPTTGSHQS